jgi:hypothetical protein
MKMRCVVLLVSGLLSLDKSCSAQIQFNTEKNGIVISADSVFSGVEVRFKFINYTSSSVYVPTSTRVTDFNDCPPCPMGVKIFSFTRNSWINCQEDIQWGPRPKPEEIKPGKMKMISGFIFPCTTLPGIYEATFYLKVSLHPFVEDRLETEYCEVASNPIKVIITKASDNYRSFGDSSGVEIRDIKAIDSVIDDQESNSVYASGGCLYNPHFPRAVGFYIEPCSNKLVKITSTHFSDGIDLVFYFVNGEPIKIEENERVNIEKVHRAYYFDNWTLLYSSVKPNQLEIEKLKNFAIEYLELFKPIDE